MVRLQSSCPSPHPLIRVNSQKSDVPLFLLARRSSIREQTGPRRNEDLWLADAPQPRNRDEFLGLATGKIPPGRGAAITRMRCYIEPTLSALGDEFVLCRKYSYHLICSLSIALCWSTATSPVLISIVLRFPLQASCSCSWPLELRLGAEPL